MKKFVLKTFLLIAVIPFVWACSSKDDQPLVIEPDTFVVVTGVDFTFPIKQGNGDYEITSDDNNIVKAGFSRTDKSPGSIVLTGVSLGKTKVKITDKATNAQVTLDVYVSAPYFGVQCGGVIADIKMVDEKADIPATLKNMLLENVPLGRLYNLYLMKDSDKLFILAGPGSANTIYEGTYEITGTTEQPFLNISFETGNSTVTKEYRPYEAGARKMIQFLGVELPAPGTRDTAPVPDYDDISFKEDLSEEVIVTYPDVATAVREIPGMAAANKWMIKAVVEKQL